MSSKQDEGSRLTRSMRGSGSSRLGASMSRLSARFSKATHAASIKASETASELRAASAKARSSAAASYNLAKTRGAELARKLEDPTKATARHALESLLGDWIEGGLGDDDETSLRVSLRKGEVTMRDVRLKPRQFESFGVASGTASEARLSIPWTKLGTAPTRVELRGVRLVLSDECGELSADNASTEWLELIDELRTKATAASKSFFSARRLALKAISRLEVECCDINVVYLQTTLRLGAVTATAGEDMYISAQLTGVELNDCISVPSSSISVNTETRVVDCSAEFASLRPVATKAAIEAITAYRAARRRAELRRDLGNSPPRPITCGASSRLWWQRAKDACLHDSRRTLARWWATVDLLQLRREYVELRRQPQPPQRLADIEKSTPIRTLLAFRAAEDQRQDEDEEEPTTFSLFFSVLRLEIMVATNCFLSLHGSSVVKRGKSVLAQARSATGSVVSSPISPERADDEPYFAVAAYSGDSLRLELKNTTATLRELSTDLRGLYDWLRDTTSVASTAMSTRPVRPLAISVEATEVGLASATTRVSLSRLDADALHNLEVVQSPWHIVVPCSRFDYAAASINVPTLEVRLEEEQFLASSDIVIDFVEKVVSIARLVMGRRSFASNLVVSEALVACEEVVAADPDELNRILGSFGGEKTPFAPRALPKFSVKRLAIGVSAEEPSLVARNVCFAQDGAKALLFERDIVLEIRVSALLRLVLEATRHWSRSSIDNGASRTSLRWPSLEIHLLNEEGLSDVDLDIVPVSGKNRIVLEEAAVSVESINELLDVKVAVDLFDSAALRLESALATALRTPDKLDVCVEVDAAAIDFRAGLDSLLRAVVAIIQQPWPSSSQETSSRATSVAVNARGVHATCDRVCAACSGLVASRRPGRVLAIDAKSLEVILIENNSSMVQLLEPASFRLEAGKVVETQLAAVRPGEPLVIYVAPADARHLSLAASEAACAVMPIVDALRSSNDTTAAVSVAVRGAATLCLVAGSERTSCPGLALDFTDPILDARHNNATLTVGLASLRAFDADREQWSTLARHNQELPVSLCAQAIDKDLRVCVGGSRLEFDIDAAGVAAIARLLKPPAGCFAEQIEIRNTFGVALQVDGQSLANRESMFRNALPLPDGSREARGEARDGAPAQPLEIVADSLDTFDVPLPRAALAGAVMALLFFGKNGMGLLVAEYAPETSQSGHGGSRRVVVTLRSAARLVNRCRSALDCKLELTDAKQFNTHTTSLTVEPLSMIDLPTARDAMLRVRRLDTATGDALDSKWYECGTLRNALRLAIAAHRRRETPLSRAAKNGNMRRGASRHADGIRWFATVEGAAAAIVVCPARRIANRLPRRVRIATARAWPGSREDYAAVYNLGPFESCDLRFVDARFWCTRLDGYEEQSDWIDTAVVSAADPMPAGADDSRSEAARLVVATSAGDDDEYGLSSLSLALEINRSRHSLSSDPLMSTTREDFGDDDDYQRAERIAGVIDLELCCSLLCVDSGTGLDLDFLGRTEASLSSSMRRLRSLAAASEEYPGNSSSRGASRHKMVDATTHAALVLEATVDTTVRRRSLLTEDTSSAARRSAPFVPAAALASQHHGRVALVSPRADGLVEVGFFEQAIGQQRVLNFVPRIAITHRAASCADMDLVARQSRRDEHETQTVAAIAEFDGNAAPFYWRRASAPFALEVAWLPRRKRRQSGPLVWTRAIQARAFEEGQEDEGVLLELPLAQKQVHRACVLKLRRRTHAATFELVAMDLSFPAKSPSLVTNTVTTNSGTLRPSSSFRGARLEVESMCVLVADLEFACTNVALAVSTKTDGSRLGLAELAGLSVRDCATDTLALSTVGDAMALRATARLRPASIGARHVGQLAGAIEIGDAALSLSEASVWRLVDAARKACAACDRELFERQRQPPTLVEVEVVRLSPLCLSPVTLLADSAARRELTRSLPQNQGGGGSSVVMRLSLSLLSAFPKLALENAEVQFDAAEVKPRPSVVSLNDLAGTIAEAYASQLRQRWWSLASSLSLSGTSNLGYGRRRPAITTSSSSIDRTASLGTGAEYDVVLESHGTLGLVIMWRDTDGAPVVAQRKAPGSHTLEAALDRVAVGDVVLAVNGRPGGSHTTDELVRIMRRRPLTLRFKRGTQDQKPRLVKILVPKSETSLGFSVGTDPRDQTLVVTEVRNGSVLAGQNIESGAKLLALNGLDVSTLPLEDLTAMCRRLASTDRTILLALPPDANPTKVSNRSHHQQFVPHNQPTTRSPSPVAADGAIPVEHRQQQQRATNCVATIFD